MEKGIFELAKATVLERRKIAEENASAVLSILYKDKKFSLLCTSEQEYIIDIARKEAEGKSADYEPLNQIRKEKLEIIKNHGFTENDITPNYQCKKCNDSGFTSKGLCDCLRAELNNLLLKKSGFIGKLPTFENSNFDLFDKNQIENMKNLYSKMYQWCNKVSDKIFLIISGNTGVGKTYLIECMASELIKNNKVVCYTTAFNLGNNMQKFHTTFDSSKDAFLSPALSSDILIIDDFGTEPIFKNITLEYLYLIVNERMLQKKPIIISTNLDIAQLYARYGERIMSRLLHKSFSVPLILSCSDLRIKK